MKLNATIFDYLTDIFVHKRMDLPLDGYVPYLINRWVSFVNPTLCTAITEQINSKGLLENKEMHYKMLICLIPKLNRCPRIQYIKKVKDEQKEQDFRIKLLAEKLELSEREIILLLDKSLAN